MKNRIKNRYSFGTRKSFENALSCVEDYSEDEYSLLAFYVSRIYPFIVLYNITNYFCLVFNPIGFDFESKIKLLIHFMILKYDSSNIIKPHHFA